ncbi:FG-GAP repeat protein [Enterovibrio norvegicus]|uniref:FG-GAP repeat protein n=1 Tax=Enterovibrio norvegicus TaxID=188144 RepID=UPI003D0EBD2A
MVRPFQRNPLFLLFSSNFFKGIGRLSVWLSVALLAGCQWLVLWEFDDGQSAGSGSAQENVLSAFNLVSITSGNTASPDAQIGRVLFEWESTTQNTSVSVTYTVCQKDTSQPNDCLSLISVDNTVSAYVDVGGALKAADDVYFVLAQAGGEYLASNERSVESEAINQLIGYFKASNTGASDIYGATVALSDDGKTLAVGAKQEDSISPGINGDESNNSRANAGTVYLYRKTNTLWGKQAYIKPNVVGGGDLFGRSVALSSDGNTLAVTAPEESSNASGVNGDASNNSIGRSGAMYIFRYQGSTWYQEAYIKPATPKNSYFFGGRVLLSNDGDVAAVCSTGDDSSATGINGDDTIAGSSNSGSMHVFRFSGGTWSQEAYIKASNTGANDRFCTSADISGDGNTLVVGAKNEDSDGVGIDAAQTNNNRSNSGAVYIFRYSAGTWSQQSFIKASNTGNGDEFGTDVALDDTGNFLAVSAPFEDSDGVGVNGTQANNLSNNTGAVYFFRFDSGNWFQEAFIKLDGPSDFDRLENVELSGDGNTLAIRSEDDSGAVGINGETNDSSQNNAGAIHVYRYRNSNWEYDHFLKATNTESDDSFGGAMSISTDGLSVAVGAQGEDASTLNINGDATVNGATNSGAVYLF